MKRSIAIALLAVMTLCILSACGGDEYMTVSGRFLKSDISDTVYIITDTNGPIEMQNKSEDKDLFDGLYNGDKIEIKCGPVRETYPASADVYKCRFIENGRITDISQDVLESLRELGRIK